jgi:hypothetical protein
VVACAGAMAHNPDRPVRNVQPPGWLRESMDIVQTGRGLHGKAGAAFPGSGGRKRLAEDSATAGGSNGAGATAERATGGTTQPAPSDAELHHWLVILAGPKGAECCLPFSADGRAKGQLDEQDMGDRHPLHWQDATRAGAHVKQVPQNIMRHLVQGACFTANGIAFMHQWVSEYSVADLLSDSSDETPRPQSPSPTPSPRSQAERRAATGKAPVSEAEPVARQLAPVFTYTRENKSKRKRNSTDSNVSGLVSGQGSARSQHASEGSDRCAGFGVWAAFACHVTSTDTCASRRVPAGTPRPVPS